MCQCGVKVSLAKITLVAVENTIKGGISRADQRSVCEMSEPKRVALIPLSAGEQTTAAAASLLTKNKDKKNSTESVKTQRFSLNLPDSTEKSCPEFHFADLIASITVYNCIPFCLGRHVFLVCVT